MWLRYSAYFALASASVGATTMHIIENIRISAALRPFSAASSRIAATRGPITLADGPDMNTHSACSAANCRPRGEVPAW